MQEEQNEQSWDHRPLKTVTINTIETAIAEAISKLLESSYKATIDQVDFDPKASAFITDMARITLTIQKGPAPGAVF